MKRLSPGVRFLLGFVTFLLCITLFAASVVSIALSGPVQILSSQENLESLLRQVLYADLLPSPQYARSSFASSSSSFLMRAAIIGGYARNGINAMTEPSTKGMDINKRIVAKYMGWRTMP